MADYSEVLSDIAEALGTVQDKLSNYSPVKDKYGPFAAMIDSMVGTENSIKSAVDLTNVHLQTLINSPAPSSTITPTIMGEWTTALTAHSLAMKKHTAALTTAGGSDGGTVRELSGATRDSRWRGSPAMAVFRGTIIRDIVVGILRGVTAPLLAPFRALAQNKALLYATLFLAAFGDILEKGLPAIADRVQRTVDPYGDDLSDEMTGLGIFGVGLATGSPTLRWIGLAYAFHVNLWNIIWSETSKWYDKLVAATGLGAIIFGLVSGIYRSLNWVFGMSGKYLKTLDDGTKVWNPIWSRIGDSIQGWIRGFQEFLGRFPQWMRSFGNFLKFWNWGWVRSVGNFLKFWNWEWIRTTFSFIRNLPKAFWALLVGIPAWWTTVGPWFTAQATALTTGVTTFAQGLTTTIVAGTLGALTAALTGIYTAWQSFEVSSLFDKIMGREQEAAKHTADQQDEYFDKINQQIDRGEITREEGVQKMQKRLDVIEKSDVENRLAKQRLAERDEPGMAGYGNRLWKYFSNWSTGAGGRPVKQHELQKLLEDAARQSMMRHDDYQLHKTTTVTPRNIPTVTKLTEREIAEALLTLPGGASEASQFGVQFNKDVIDKLDAILESYNGSSGKQDEITQKLLEILKDPKITTNIFPQQQNTKPKVPGYLEESNLNNTGRESQQ